MCRLLLKHALCVDRSMPSLWLQLQQTFVEQPRSIWTVCSWGLQDTFISLVMWPCSTAAALCYLTITTKQSKLTHLYEGNAEAATDGRMRGVFSAPQSSERKATTDSRGLQISHLYPDPHTGRNEPVIVVLLPTAQVGTTTCICRSDTLTSRPQSHF